MNYAIASAYMFLIRKQMTKQVTLCNMAHLLLTAWHHRVNGCQALHVLPKTYPPGGVTLCWPKLNPLELPANAEGLC